MPTARGVAARANAGVIVIGISVALRDLDHVRDTILPYVRRHR